MTIFLISLAGLPVTAGFIGKFMIFMDTIAQGVIWLAVIMVLTSVVSYFYYFGIIRQMYLRTGESEAPIKLSGGITAVIIFCLLGTVLIGIMPTPVIEGLSNLQFHTLFLRGE